MFKIWPSPGRLNAAAINRRGRALRNVGETGTVEIDGVTLAYWRLGEQARTLVCVHGNSALKEAFHLQFSSLRDEGFALIAIDLPGHGASSDAARPEEQYTITGYARLIGRALDCMGVSKPVILGWSLGGNIALEMVASGIPIKALALAGAPPVGPGAEHYEAAFRAHPVSAIMAKRDAARDEIATFVRAIYPTNALADSLFMNAALRTDGRAREIMVSHWLSGHEGFDQRKTAQSWDGPICVVHGAQDPFLSLDYLRAIAWRNLWRGQVTVIERSGHAPFLEQHTVFNAFLSEFLSEVGA